MRRSLLTDDADANQRCILSECDLQMLILSKCSKVVWLQPNFTLLYLNVLSGFRLKKKYFVESKWFVKKRGNNKIY